MEKWEKKALAFATAAHEGQLCDNGKTVIENHILPVVAILKQITKDQDIITAGYVHDTIEDTTVSHFGLTVTFGAAVADIVQEVTNEQLYGIKDYFPNLKTRKAIIVKFADRLQNLSRMDPWDEKRQQRYMDRSKFWRGKEDVESLLK